MRAAKEDAERVLGGVVMMYDQVWVLRAGWWGSRLVACRAAQAHQPGCMQQTPCLRPC